jgi:hypothetical protein
VLHECFVGAFCPYLNGELWMLCRKSAPFLHKTDERFQRQQISIIGDAKIERMIF